MIGNEFLGKTVDAAIETGLKKLKLSREDADIKILDDLGKKCKVLVRKKLTEGQLAMEFAENLFEKMKVSAVVELNDKPDEAELVVSTTDFNSVVGKRGEVLDAVQYLCSMVANKQKETFRRIVVDCDDYRNEREKMIVEVAKRAEKKAFDLAKKIALDPMNPYERRIIHAALQNSDKVKTESKGEDPNRKVIIIPNNLKKFVPRQNSRPFNRNGYNRNQNGFERKPFNNNRNFNNNENNSFARDNNGAKNYNKPFNKPGENRNANGFEKRQYNGARNNNGGSYNNRDNNSNGYNNGGYNKNSNYGNRSNSGYNGNNQNNSFKKRTDFNFGTFLGNSLENKKEEKADKE